MFMEIAFIFLVGALFGIIVGLHITRANPDGCLWINMSDPNKEPTMGVELYKHLGKIYHKGYGTFVVNVKDQETQK